MTRRAGAWIAVWILRHARRRRSRAGARHAAQPVAGDGQDDRRGHDRRMQVEGLRDLRRSRRSGGAGARHPARRAGDGSDGGNGPAQGVHRPNVPHVDAGVSEADGDDPTLLPQRDVSDILALGGGVPIQAGTEVIGGVGSSGSSQEMDDTCAKAGVAKVAEQLK